MSFTLAPFFTQREVDDILYCELCLNLRQDVFNCAKCNIHVCRKCAVSRLLKYARCPQCKDLLTANEMKTSSLTLKDKLSAFNASNCKKMLKDNKNTPELDTSVIPNIKCDQDSLYFQNSIGLSKTDLKILYCNNFENEVKSKLNLYSPLDVKCNQEFHSQFDARELKDSAESINKFEVPDPIINRNSAFLQHFSEQHNEGQNTLNGKRIEHIHYRQYTMTEFDKSEMTNMKCYQEFHYQNFGELSERYTNISVFKSKDKRTKRSKGDMSDTETDEEQYFEAYSELPETESDMLYQSNLENTHPVKSTKSKNNLLYVSDIKSKGHSYHQTCGQFYQTEAEVWKNSGCNNVCKSMRDKPKINRCGLSDIKRKHNPLQLQSSFSMFKMEPKKSKLQLEKVKSELSEDELNSNQLENALKATRCEAKSTSLPTWDELTVADPKLFEKTDIKKKPYKCIKRQKQDELSYLDHLGNLQTPGIEISKQDDEVSTEVTENLEQNDSVIVNKEMTSKFKPVITQVISVLELYYKKFKNLQKF